MLMLRPGMPGSRASGAARLPAWRQRGCLAARRPQPTQLAARTVTFRSLLGQWLCPGD